MRCSNFVSAVSVVGLAIAAMSVASGVAVAESPADEALDKLVADYAAAWNAGDVEALKKLWTDDGEFIDSNGQSLDRAKLLAAKMQGDAKSRPRLAISLQKKTLLSDTVAMLQGTSNRHSPEGASIERLRFSGIAVKQGDAWRMRVIRALDVVAVESDKKPLADLQWMVGHWVGIGNGTQATIETRWEMGGRYLVSNMQITRPGEGTFMATRRVGWDPLSRTIKSWYFDSRGTILTGTWEKHDSHWVITTAGAGADGKAIAATSAITPVDEQSYLKTLSNIRVGGAAMPEQELRVFRFTEPAKQQ